MLGAAGGRFFGVGAFALALQVVLGHAAIDQIPRKHLVKGEGAVGVETRIDPGAGEVLARRIRRPFGFAFSLFQFLLVASDMKMLGSDMI